MNTLPETDLRQKAEGDCQQAFSELMDTEFFVSSVSSAYAWEPVLQKHIYQHAFVVWRPFDQIELIMDSSNQVVKFTDHNRLQGATYVPLNDEDILFITSTTGMLCEAAKVESSQKVQDGLISALIVQQHTGLPRRISFLVNPATRVVAALEVIQK